MHINELTNIINMAIIKQGFNPFLPIIIYSEEDIKRVKRILNTLIEEIDINMAIIKQGYNPLLPIITYSEEDIKRIKRILNTLIEEIDDVWKEHKGKV